MKRNYQEVLKEIRELHANYKETIQGRRNIINEIMKKIGEIRSMTPICNAELADLENYYKYRNFYFSDYRMTMNLLLRLANVNEDNYTMKEVTTTGYDNTTGSEVNRFCSRILFITEKSLADKIENRTYYFDEFKRKATEAINKGYSMIIITSSWFENTVKPKFDEVKCDKAFDITNSNLMGNISCYVNNNDFEEAISKLTEYVKVNGPDFSDIDEDVLFDLMNSIKISNEKKIVK